MKRIDFYAAPRSFQMPKWLGAVVGGVFMSMIFGSAFIFVRLTHPAVEGSSPLAASAVQLAPDPVLPPSPSAVPSVTVATPTEAEPALAGSSVSPPRPTAGERAHARLHSARRHHGGKPMLASAEPTTKRAQQILAHHESRDKRRAKDEIDRLLGM